MMHIHSQETFIYIIYKYVITIIIIFESKKTDDREYTF